MSRYLNEELFEKNCNEIDEQYCDNCLIMIEETKKHKRYHDNKINSLQKWQYLQVQDEIMKEFIHQRSMYIQYMKNMIEWL